MVGYPVERSDGDVFAAGLDRRQVGSVHANSFGYFGLRLTAAGTRVAHTLAKLLKSLHSVDYIPHACRLKPSPLMLVVNLRCRLGQKQEWSAGAGTPTDPTHTTERAVTCTNAPL